MNKTTSLLIWALLLSLAACGKQEADRASGANAGEKAAEHSYIGGPDGRSEDDTPVAAEQAASGLPQPDMKKPLSSYPELQSGQQIMFLYVAASKLPPDYPKLAEWISDDYRMTSDNFRKNDLLSALKPQMEQKIKQAEANPYAWMQVDGVSLEPYDFERKGFSVGEFAGNQERYFYDVSQYRLRWANADQVQFVSVPDEAKAREIETLRSQYVVKAKVYFFAQSADLNSRIVQAYVTHVVITDQSGRMLVEYGPQGG